MVMTLSSPKLNRLEPVAAGTENRYSCLRKDELVECLKKGGPTQNPLHCRNTTRHLGWLRSDPSFSQDIEVEEGAWGQGLQSHSNTNPPSLPFLLSGIASPYAPLA